LFDSVVIITNSVDDDVFNKFKNVFPYSSDRIDAIIKFQTEIDLSGSLPDILS
jgi:hypothetical protein